MKKFLVGLSTFAVGVLFSYSFYFLNVSDSRLDEKVQTAGEDETYICSFVPNNEIHENKTETFKPFFDSFDETEGFNGWFIADKFKGMKEVWAISLGRDSENPQTEELKWSAMILTVNKDDSVNDDDDFHSIQIKTNGRKLSFTTNKVRGIEYKFAGEFGNDFYKFDESKKVLKGILQKFVNGKKVAEFVSDFKYYEPHCLH
jgi:hypothetical protein